MSCQRKCEEGIMQKRTKCKYLGGLLSQVWLCVMYYKDSGETESLNLGETEVRGAKMPSSQ